MANKIFKNAVNISEDFSPREFAAALHHYFLSAENLYLRNIFLK